MFQLFQERGRNAFWRIPEGENGMVAPTPRRKLFPIAKIETKSAVERNTRHMNRVQKSLCQPVGLSPETLKRIKIMFALARTIKQAFFTFSPKTEVPTPANDNVDRIALQTYLKAWRDHAGDDYQPAGAKMWWLP